MKKTGVLFFTLAVLSILPWVSLAQDLPDFSGQIAYVGTDLNVYTLVGQSGTPVAISDDAAVTQTSARVYSWPTWSTEGQLAYFRTNWDATSGITTDVMISPDGQTPGESAYTGTDEVFTYANWSPRDCGADCRDLAVLLNDRSGLLVELVRWQDGAGTSVSVGRGSPFYYSWSVDGTRMLMQRNNRQFEIFDTNESRITDTLEQVPGVMFAPAWSPVDDRLLLGMRNEDVTDLVIAASGEVTTLAAGQSKPIWFSWSPDGNRVAYIDREGPLLVLDAASGETTSRSPISGVLAFFWSPDSQHIAYLTVAAPPGSFNAGAPGDVKIAALVQQEPPGLAWSVLDIADGATRRYGAFQPTNDLIYLLNYFDQFAQSHRLWSPDSHYLIYGETTTDQRRVISLLDTTQEIAVPQTIAEGTIGIWSFN